LEKGALAPPSPAGRRAGDEGPWRLSLYRSLVRVGSQVVTLRVPAERLHEVNRAIEETAWGGYHTEFYPTYDLEAVAEQLHAQVQ
jgi:hypothetical protein